MGHLLGFKGGVKPTALKGREASMGKPTCWRCSGDDLRGAERAVATEKRQEGERELLCGPDIVLASPVWGRTCASAGTGPCATRLLCLGLRGLMVSCLIALALVVS